MKGSIMVGGKKLFVKGKIARILKKLNIKIWPLPNGLGYTQLPGDLGSKLDLLFIDKIWLSY